MERCYRAGIYRAGSDRAGGILNVRRRVRGCLEGEGGLIQADEKKKEKKDKAHGVNLGAVSNRCRSRCQNRAVKSRSFKSWRRRLARDFASEPPRRAVLCIGYSPF